MAQNDIEFLFPVYVPKSCVWTVKNKYPRTTQNVNYRDWSSNPIRGGMNMYVSPRRNPWHPTPPLRQFRPLPEMDEKKDTEIRLGMASPRGRKTPAEALHFGYRKFSLDPTSKGLRHFNDPIPHPLHTIYRQSYVSPAGHLICEQNKTRYGLTPRHVAFGIVPLALSIPPEPVKDTSESMNFVYKPKDDKTNT